MKFRRVISVILALLAVTTLFAACSPTNKPGTTNANGTKDDPSDGGSSVKMKFLKAGRSSCIVIRTPAGNVMIDTAADDKTDKVLTYLAEKSITRPIVRSKMTIPKKVISILPFEAMLFSLFFSAMTLSIC